MVMAESTRQVLKMCGIDPERFALEWASAAEGPRFVQIITEFVNKIKGLGPLGDGEGEAGRDEVERRLAAAIKAATNTKVRTAFGTLARSLHKSGSYDRDSIVEGVEKKVVPAVEKVMEKSA